jgi:hypothetical protein
VLLSAEASVHAATAQTAAWDDEHSSPPQPAADCFGIAEAESERLRRTQRGCRKSSPAEARGDIALPLALSREAVALFVAFNPSFATGGSSAAYVRIAAQLAE